MSFTQQYLSEVQQIVGKLDQKQIEKMVVYLEQARDARGRLFILGVGGSAANASHAVNDFRKITGIEAYAPTDNVAELTARTNDDGWETVFENWLKISRLNRRDAVLVLSVGGGNVTVSYNLVRALEHARSVGARILGIVGRDGGFTAGVADAFVLVPTVSADHITPHAEAFQAVVWHLLVSHPKLKRGLRVKLFADGADEKVIRELRQDPRIQGFTTNPTLMRKAGVTNYADFAHRILEAADGLPVSFEAVADGFTEMERQARSISRWGSNVYVKIPVTNTHGESCRDLIYHLSHSGVKVNVTAVMTLEQVSEIRGFLAGGAPSYISVFAGRVADTGVDPVPIMKRAVELLQPYPQIELIWASPRELLNIFQADAVGCHIITSTLDILKKLPLVGKDLMEYSLETVKMFFDDAVSSGFMV